MLFHKHLLVNAHVAKPLVSEQTATAFLTELVARINMKILRGPFACYLDIPGNRGLTGIVLIETSHIAFHIWDESDPAHLQFDLYTCGELNHEDVLEVITETFEPVSMEFMLLDREKGFVVEKQNSDFGCQISDIISE